MTVHSSRVTSFSALPPSDLLGSAGARASAAGSAGAGASLAEATDHATATCVSSGLSGAATLRRISMISVSADTPSASAS